MCTALPIGSFLLPPTGNASTAAVAVLCLRCLALRAPLCKSVLAWESKGPSSPSRNTATTRPASCFVAAGIASTPPIDRCCSVVRSFRIRGAVAVRMRACLPNNCCGTEPTTAQHNTTQHNTTHAGYSSFFLLGWDRWENVAVPSIHRTILSVHERILFALRCLSLRAVFCGQSMEIHPHCFFFVLFRCVSPNSTIVSLERRRQPTNALFVRNRGHAQQQQQQQQHLPTSKKPIQKDLDPNPPASKPEIVP